MPRTASNPQITVVPANQASWDDLRAIFGARGDPVHCQCQWFKTPASEWRSIAASVGSASVGRSLPPRSTSPALAARALEGYAMITDPERDVAWGELFVGSRSIFAAAGFREVTHPTARRVVMRIDFEGSGA